jgi:hypothetical protein
MRKLAVVFLLVATLRAMGAAPKSLFSMTTSAPSVQSFLDHAKKIDILVPTLYSTDARR